MDEALFNSIQKKLNRCKQMYIFKWSLNLCAKKATTGNIQNWTLQFCYIINLLESKREKIWRNHFKSVCQSKVAFAPDSHSSKFIYRNERNHTTIECRAKSVLVSNYFFCRYTYFSTVEYYAYFTSTKTYFKTIEYWGIRIPFFSAYNNRNTFKPNYGFPLCISKKIIIKNIYRSCLNRMKSTRFPWHHMTWKRVNENNWIYLECDLVCNLRLDGQMCSRVYIRRLVIWICLFYRYRIHRARAFEIAFVVMGDFLTLIHATLLFLLMYSLDGNGRE